MEDDEEFVDFYAQLGVARTSDRAVIEKAYRRLAQLYHPDHTETADVDRFQEVTRAYRLLKNDKRRAKYDELWDKELGSQPNGEAPRDDIVIDGATAVQDAEMHETLLLALYRKRRENPRDPGLMPYYAQREIGCSDDSFEFHMWYLKAKGFIQITQESELVITIEGVDHVISNSRAAKERLLLEQALASRE